MARQKKSSYRDMQILLAIKKLKRCSILELLNYCIENYSICAWDYHKIRNSIVRLYNNDKIEFEYDITKIIWNYKKRNLNSNRKIKYIIIKGDE